MRVTISTRDRMLGVGPTHDLTPGATPESDLGPRPLCCTFPSPVGAGPRGVLRLGPAAERRPWGHLDVAWTTSGVHACPFPHPRARQ